MESAPALKYCPCCQQVKDSFSPDRRNKDGLNYRCRSCSSLHKRVLRTINPEPARFAVRKYREALRDYSA